MLNQALANKTLLVVKDSDKKCYSDSKLLKHINSKKMPVLFKQVLNYASRKDIASFNSPQPERSLWRMVLLQAFEDSITCSKKPEARSCKRQAMAWIFTDNDDFFQVCSNSDVDAKKFRDFVSNKIRMKNLVQVAM